MQRCLSSTLILWFLSKKKIPFPFPPPLNNLFVASSASDVVKMDVQPKSVSVAASGLSLAVCIGQVMTLPLSLLLTQIRSTHFFSSFARLVVYLFILEYQWQLCCLRLFLDCPCEG